MLAAASIEVESNYNAAQSKYNEANTVNASVQSSYEAFTNSYQAEKVRLTNIDNL
jgi:hypothetical protein